MRTLSEHFYEITNRIKINQELIDQAHLKISEINKEIKKQKGGELVNEDELIKCEDEIKEFTLGNKIYKICVREIKKNKSEKYYIINFYSPSVECVILELSIKAKTAHLTELIKQDGCLMQKKNQYDDKPKETGVLLMEIIIKVCKEFNINEITLTDNSYILCKNNANARINLIYSKMMLDGESWYGKFGFEPVDEFDKNIYMENQENYKKNKLTKEIKKEYFTKDIIDKEKNKNNIKEIEKKYDEMREEKLSVFVGWISENYCSIYSEIYEYIYKKSGYKKYSSLKFVLKLNTDLTEFVNLVKNGKL